MKLRTSLSSFFTRYEAAWEIFMVLLAIIFVIIGFLPDYVDLSPGALAALATTDIAITASFVLEFATRILVARSRAAYLKGHWLDLVALLPAVRWLRMARFVRIIRLLRIVRLARVFSSLDHLGFNLAQFVRLNGLQWMLLTLFGIMLAFSGLFYWFEHGVNDKVLTYWDALYGALVTWSTPGYADIIPITTGGKISGLTIIVSGLVTWGILIANLSAFLLGRETRKKETDPAIADIQQKLARFDRLTEQELITLRGAVIALVDSKVDKD